MLRSILATATAAGALFGLAMLGAAPAGAVTATNSTTGFADNSNFLRTVTFLAGDFSGSSLITDLDVSITFAKHDGESFISEGSATATSTPFFNEIEFVLTSPSGTNITLISNDGDTEIVAADNFESFNSGGTNVFSGTILFDQSASNPVDVDPDQVQAGAFRPDDDLAGNLDSFIGEDAVGVWTLFIEDDVGADGLSFYEFSVIVNGGGQQQGVPEPMTLTLFGAGLLGLGLVARRRRMQA